VAAVRPVNWGRVLALTVVYIVLTAAAISMLVPFV
jgi:hypothetical protein